MIGDCLPPCARRISRRAPARVVTCAQRPGVLLDRSGSLCALIWWSEQRPGVLLDRSGSLCDLTWCEEQRPGVLLDRSGSLCALIYLPCDLDLKPYDYSAARQFPLRCN
jgi:hypothetical protein